MVGVALRVLMKIFFFIFYVYFFYVVVLYLVRESHMHDLLNVDDNWITSKSFVPLYKKC